MRLCWNDSFNGPLGKLRREEAEFVYNIGYRVAGINAGVTEATDAEIEHAKGVFEDVGLTPGPYGLGASAIRPDKADEKKQMKMIADALRIAGKLGCTTLRYSVGSLHPKDIWMHHPDNVTQKALDDLVDNTRELVPVAEEANCILCPETTLWTVVNSIERMEEFVDRCNSPFVRIILDPVNHMTAQRVYDNGRWMKCAIARLGDRIGVLHVKDVMVQDKLLVVHIDEAEMGTGLLDHEALITASDQLEPWKTFSLEHIRERNLIKNAHDHIQGVADRMGYRWTDPKCTRERWEKGECR